MRKIYTLITFLVLSFQNSFSQSMQLSVYSEVSIITIGPGTNLNDIFGHNAIRIKDPVLNFDLVYNYGVFNYNAPNFYSNFTKGKLLYKLGIQRFDGFLRDYKSQQRWVKEQVLNLNQSEKQAFFVFLQNNALPQNSSYLYDPYFDNCATKLRDITQDILKEKTSLSTDYLEEGMTFRKLMNRELIWNTWGNFGINTALGNKLDKVANASEYMYLPDYVYLAFKNAKKKDSLTSLPLIKSERTLLDFEEKGYGKVWYNPLTLFSVIFLLVIFITYKDSRGNKRTQWLDFTLFFITGLIGVFLTFLWFFTDHSTTPNNLNVLWGFPLNFFIAFLLLKKNPIQWISKYLKFCLFLLVMIPFVWVFGIQLFPIAGVPLYIALFTRYFFLSKLLTSK